ncbi:ATP-binding cassette domain-containing protein [bacterium]|nr:ATP-binding cassette domain-containing protein [bacterium]
MIAVMGPSVCGKSTLLECLSGLRAPRAGSFTMGGETHDTAPIFAASFVEQRPYLFVGSVKENLLLGNRRHGMEDSEIWSALETVDLAETIKQRGGVNTVLTNRGLNLSEGQRYRLTLCRALLARRPFLFLDEPFAALDKDSISSVVRAVEWQRQTNAGAVIMTHVLPDDLRPDRVVTFANR